MPSQKKFLLRCGDKTLSGICINKFASPITKFDCHATDEVCSSMKTDCSFKDESEYNSNSSINSNSNSSINSSSSINSNSNSISSINSNSNSNSNSSSSSNIKVLTRNCNKCNSVKPITDFDESKYTCRNCTSAKVKCLYCPYVVRYDGIRAHVKKQHPDVELTEGSGNLLHRFSRNLREKNVFTQTGESCSCKYYNFVSFLINNGINIEKLKENMNILKSVDNSR